MRYFIGFMLLIALLIFLIVLVVMGRGSRGPVIPTRELASYSTTNAQVSFRDDGQINANSEHRQIQITVDRRNVLYEEIAGYDGRVVNSKRFNNTENAYNVFLSALGHAGFTLRDKSEALVNEKGRCPLGRRYIFEMSEGSKLIQRSWATSCGNQRPI